MFHKTDLPPDAVLDPANSVRISEGLEPYRAPSAWSQWASVVGLILLVGTLVLIVQ
jgi:hypothetical protein